MDPNVNGAGPFTFESPALSGGEVWRIDFESFEKGKYRRYVPWDSLLVKNYDTDNRIDVTINGVEKVDVDPNGKDSYDRTDIRSLKVVNVGGTTINAADVTLSVKNDPWGADDAALERKKRHPVANMARGFLNL